MSEFGPLTNVKVVLSRYSRIATFLFHDSIPSRTVHPLRQYDSCLCSTQISYVQSPAVICTGSVRNHTSVDVMSNCIQSRCL